VSELELVLDARAGLGEGPVWDAGDGTLLWVDIEAGVLHRLDPADGADRAEPVGGTLGAVALTTDGGVLLARGRDLVLGDRVVPVEPARPGNRLNDGKVDPQGRFVVGSMSLDESIRSAGALYRYGPAGLERLLVDVSLANGLAWSPDGGTMYFIDTPTRELRAYPYGDVLGAPRTVAAFAAADGWPDGMAIDAEGCLWVAFFGGSAVRRYSPAGALLRTVALPPSQVTSCAFGGLGLSVLYVTTAARGVAPDVVARTGAGGLFAVDAGVAGASVPRFMPWPAPPS
jgi:sugar lactone lactonase YvrE